jgi:regulatory protein
MQQPRYTSNGTKSQRATRQTPRERRAPRPLDAARLQELALAYVARFATSGAKLEDYLRRKLRERGWEGDDPARPDLIAARFAELGYIDDEAYARAKSGSLLRRGYGARRVRQALGQAGIAPDIQEDIAAGEAERRHAALALARKRRFGPFGQGEPDRDLRAKQVSAMLRAGHDLDFAKKMVDAATEAAAEEWAAACDEEQQ